MQARETEGVPDMREISVKKPREARHARRLNRVHLSDEAQFDAVLRKATTEIHRGEGLPAALGLSLSEIADQMEAGMRAVRVALTQLLQGNASRVDVLPRFTSWEICGAAGRTVTQTGPIGERQSKNRDARVGCWVGNDGGMPKGGNCRAGNESSV
ncbi:hypothetical protein [Pandoraea sp. NPDC087047]|uniref:hypothetical protein n=1 Tax=Pandoraea sp. NPDC087047 TaxID=3364390 RepID=UPI0037FEEDE1